MPLGYPRTARDMYYIYTHIKLQKDMHHLWVGKEDDVLPEK